MKELAESENIFDRMKKLCKEQAELIQQIEERDRKNMQQIESLSLQVKQEENSCQELEKTLNKYRSSASVSDVIEPFLSFLGMMITTLQDDEAGDLKSQLCSYIANTLFSRMDEQGIHIHAYSPGDKLEGDEIDTENLHINYIDTKEKDLNNVVKRCVRAGARLKDGTEIPEELNVYRYKKSETMETAYVTDTPEEESFTLDVRDEEEKEEERACDLFYASYEIFTGKTDGKKHLRVKNIVILEPSAKDRSVMCHRKIGKSVNGEHQGFELVIGEPGTMKRIFESRSQIQIVERDGVHTYSIEGVRLLEFKFVETDNNRFRFTVCCNMESRKGISIMSVEIEE